MAITPRQLLLRILYAVIFCAAIPAFLVFWSWRLDQVLPGLLPVHAPVAGTILATIGLALILVAMLTLMLRGKGLPMNAFPPVRLVTTGIYAVSPHPIYVGFTLLCAGSAIASGSAGALWIVTPLVAFSAAALVWGYERPDLLARFGTRARPFIGLPPPGAEKPSIAECLGLMLLIFPLWLVLYESLFFLGLPPDAFDVHLTFESTWPVLPWTEPLYASAYFVPLAVLLAPTRDVLRRFGIQASLALVLVTFCYLLVPAISPARLHHATGILGTLLDLERASSTPPVAALPSFHVIWACLAADLLAKRSRPWAAVAWVWALAVAASCITTGMHALVDIAAALLAFLSLRRYDVIYALLLRITERLANSWREWRFGPLRIINHGIYAGAAGFTGVLIMSWLSGYTGWTFFVAGTGLVAAALLAQTVEGSPTLLRPFGYYGFLAGALLAVAICLIAGGPALQLFAAGAVAAPWAQALGRLRCLVQGCCHGKPVAASFGIRVLDPHSRVTKPGHLTGIPIHPTQLYSILGNVVIGMALVRLWSLAVPLSFVAGLYLLLSGLARFVEETYRGEPQTPSYASLAIYHWMALASLVLGLVVTCLPSPAAVPPAVLPTPAALLAAGAAFLLFFLAMAVDLPDSTLRFTRLSG